ncbi:MAG: hypothetical protein C0597_14770 [Marinilabiliales bacterium]|nr:MAG: hypothetical protein C0597_14770 [Marinilabiliales bacterium]
MRKILLLLMLGLLFWACNPNTKNTAIEEKSHITVYDSTLVNEYGADQYGMKTYVIAFLKRGPNRSKDSVEAARLQKVHLENINQLAEEGKLVLAGPFFGDGDLRGIYVFDVNSIEEAEKLTESDPLIQSGGLIMELHKWYGSAAVMAIPEIHKKLEKVNVAE